MTNCRQSIKDGKRERIKALLDNMRFERDRFNDHHTLAEAVEGTGEDRRTPANKSNQAPLRRFV